MRTRFARAGVVAVLSGCLGIIGADAAGASWTAGAQTAVSRSRALTLPTGNEPSAVSPLATHTVIVSWATSTGGAPVAGYQIRAFNGLSGVSRAVAGSCGGLVSGATCNDTAVPNGTWKYSVTPRQQLWAGTESNRSAAVVVLGL